MASIRKKLLWNTIISAKIIKCTEKDLKLWGPFLTKFDKITAIRKSTNEKPLQVSKSYNATRKIQRYEQWKIPKHEKPLH